MIEQHARHFDSSPLSKGQHVELTISALTPTGAGISKDFGKPIFVERVAAGDVVEVELFDVRKDFARGKVVSIKRPSADRQAPPCRLFKVCGGCQWQHISYQSQLKAKTDLVKQSVQYIGGIDADLVEKTIGARSELYYRNKVQFPTRNPRGSSRILAGYFKQDSHELVNIKHCPVQPDPLDRMLEATKAACEENQLPAYDESTGAGLLRHITARHSIANDTILVTLVVNAVPDSPNQEDLRQQLTRIAEQVISAVSEVVGVCVNYNTMKGNKIYGTATECLVGQEYLEEKLISQRADLPAQLRDGIRFRLSSTSFFQVNTAQAVTLLELLFDETSKAAAQLQGRKPVIVDAFAGVGTMSLWLSPLAERIIAVEEHGAAVEDGRVNAELNGASNVAFVQGSVEQVLPRLAELGTRADILVLDPPRKGLSPETTQVIKRLAVPVVLYVSCNPTTLARDLKILRAVDNDAHKTNQIGYKTKKIQPVDLFPQTFHVESVAVLERIDSNGLVRDMEEA